MEMTIRLQHLPLQSPSSSPNNSKHPLLLVRCQGPHQNSSSSSSDAGLLFRQKMLYLQRHLNLDASKALTLNPGILSAPISTLHSTETCLLSFGIPLSQLRRIFGMHPILLTSSPHAYLYPVFDFLLNEAHIPFHDLYKSVCRCPRLLVSSVSL